MKELKAISTDFHAVLSKRVTLLGSYLIGMPLVLANYEQKFIAKFIK